MRLKEWCSMWISNVGSSWLIVLWQKLNEFKWLFALGSIGKYGNRSENNNLWLFNSAYKLREF